MKIVSFNVNGIRARLHQLQAVIENHAPEIIGLQETKVTDEDFPVDAVRELGYHVEYYGQKSHYGVALLSRQAPLQVVKGLPGDAEDSQRRLIGAAYETVGGGLLWVLNAYFPQGESRQHAVKFPAKERFYHELGEFLKGRFTDRDALIVMGDANVAPRDEDIGIGEDNAKRWLRTGKCSFLPEERVWLQTLLDGGLADTFRLCHADAADLFSWFDYRSRGFEREPRRGLRIDLILASQILSAKCTQAGIDYAVRAMDKSSDHCPVWTEVDICLLNKLSK
jgi:exodeoxyribonuclease-3